MRATLAFLFLAAALEPALASGVLRSRKGGPPIPPVSRRVVATVDDGLAETTVTETFLAPGREPFGALYEVQLPVNALLTGAEVRTGGLRLVAAPAPARDVVRIREAVYAESLEPVRVRYLAERIWRLAVGPVLPGEALTVELRWIHPTPLSNGSYTIEIPLGPPVGSKDVPTAAVQVTFRSSVPISSVLASRPGFDLKRPDIRTAIVSFAGLPARRREVLSCEAVVETLTTRLHVTTCRRGAKRGWFKAVITPPTLPPKASVPRDVILVLDTSRSMEGKKLANMKAAVHYLLRHLRPVDRINIVRFSGLANAFAPEPVAVVPENLRRLRRYVDAMGAIGGTALGDALEKAIDVPPVAGRVRTVALLTDGKPTKGITDTRSILRFARNARTRGFRIFAIRIGVGRSWLLDRIARVGGGESWVISPDEEIRSALVAFLERSSTPILSDLLLALGDSEPSEVLPLAMPEVFIGEQLVVVGRYLAGGRRTARVTGRFGIRPIRLSRELEWQIGDGGDPGAARHFVCEKLRILAVSRQYRKRLTDAGFQRLLSRGGVVWPGDEEGELRKLALELGWRTPGSAYVLVRPEDRTKQGLDRTGDLEKALEQAENARRLVLTKRGLVIRGKRPRPGSAWARFGRIDVEVGLLPHR